MTHEQAEEAITQFFSSKQSRQDCRFGLSALRDHINNLIDCMDGDDAIAERYAAHSNDNKK